MGSLCDGVTTYDIKKNYFAALKCSSDLSLVIEGTFFSYVYLWRKKCILQM